MALIHWLINANILQIEPFTPKLRKKHFISSPHPTPPKKTAKFRSNMKQHHTQQILCFFPTAYGSRTVLLNMKVLRFSFWASGFSTRIHDKFMVICCVYPIFTSSDHQKKHRKKHGPKCKILWLFVLGATQGTEKKNTKQMREKERKNVRQKTQKKHRKKHEKKHGKNTQKPRKKARRKTGPPPRGNVYRKEKGQARKNARKKAPEHSEKSTRKSTKNTTSKITKRHQKKHDKKKGKTVPEKARRNT